MRVITILVFVLLLFQLFYFDAYAKRAAPSKVKSVTHNSIEYRAPLKRSAVGVVEAWDKTSNRLIFKRQIYVVKYNSIETDVQDVFIKSLVIEDGKLVISNERKSKYSLDLKSLEIKVIKGNLVEAFKGK
jgi:hypothetical protein